MTNQIDVTERFSDIDSSPTESWRSAYARRTMVELAETLSRFDHPKDHDTVRAIHILADDQRGELDINSFACR